MKSEFPSAQEYSAQTARFPALAVVDIRAEQAVVTDSYRNEVLVDVNNDCVRLAVFEGEYRWHRHPDSDETFFGVDGQLVIEFPDREVVVNPGQFVTVPAGTLHRTRPAGARSVNLTFERAGAITVFEE